MQSWHNVCKINVNFPACCSCNKYMEHLTFYLSSFQKKAPGVVTQNYQKGFN